LCAHVTVSPLSLFFPNNSTAVIFVFPPCSDCSDREGKQLWCYICYVGIVDSELVFVSFSSVLRGNAVMLFCFSCLFFVIQVQILC
jgi:hypothetical protein